MQLQNISLHTPETIMKTTANVSMYVHFKEVNDLAQSVSFLNTISYSSSNQTWFHHRPNHHHPRLPQWSLLPRAVGPQCVSDGTWGECPARCLGLLHPPQHHPRNH